MDIETQKISIVASSTKSVAASVTQIHFFTNLLVFKPRIRIAFLWPYIFVSIVLFLFRFFVILFSSTCMRLRSQAQLSNSLYVPSFVLSFFFFFLKGAAFSKHFLSLSFPIFLYGE